MRFILATIGSHGDVHPFLAVGRALTARGHEVTLLVHPHFNPEAHDAGLETVPLSPEIDVSAAMSDPDLMHPRKGGRRVFDLIFGGAASACRTLDMQIDQRRPHALLCHHICFGMRWIAERRGLPAAHAVLSPQLWFNRWDPVHAMQKSPGRASRLMAGALGEVLRPFVPLLFDAPFNRLRRELGCPRGRDWLVRECRGGDRTLGLWSTAYRASRPGDPEQGVICGFPWHDRSHSRPLPEEAERFLAEGEPPIIFSLGTAVIHAPGNFYEVAVDAAQRLGRRAILLTGRESNTPPNLPRGILALPYAPFSLLMPRSAVSVHHGGIGSTAQGLRSGRPCVIVPHAHDQFNNAVRAHDLGCARIVQRAKLDAPRLARALADAATDPAMTRSAQTVAAALANENGAERAAVELEGLARAPG